MGWGGRGRSPARLGLRAPDDGPEHGHEPLEAHGDPHRDDRDGGRSRGHPAAADERHVIPFSPLRETDPRTSSCRDDKNWFCTKSAGDNSTGISVVK